MFAGSSELIIGFVFCCFGFIIAYFMSKSVNLIIFAGLLYATFKALDALNFGTNWEHLDAYVSSLSDLGTAAFSLVKGLLERAGTIAIVLFIFGGVTGLTIRKRRA
jgi:hypothetical protein